MNFSNQILKKYKVVVLADGLGYMTKKELLEKLPDLGKAYLQVYGKDRPDIKIIASEHFSFPVEEWSSGSRHVIYAVLDGEVKKIPNLYGKAQTLLPNSMILDCMVGHLNYCRLYVHPESATPLLKEADELTDDEYCALYVLKTRIPAAREKEYFYMKYGMDSYEGQKKHPDEYKNALKPLVEKGLVKLNAKGAAQLTIEGKNRALQAEKKVKEKFHRM